jgi:tetratricopeptide (TPR) repeat protein
MARKSNQHTADEPVIKNEKQFSLYSAILFVVTGFLIYSNVFNNTWHFDDILWMFDPMYHSMSNAGDIFKDHSLRFLGFFSFAFNYDLHGPRLEYFYLTNILIHLLNTFLVWGLIRTIFKVPKISNLSVAKYGLLIAFFGGLIYLTHPLQTQAVSYIYQRLASIAALFYLGTAFFYLKGRVSGNKAYYVAAVVAFVLSLFTKQNVVTLPVMILVMEIVLFNENKKLGGLHYLLLGVVGAGIIMMVLASVKPELFPFLYSRGRENLLEPVIYYTGQEVTPGVYLMTQFKVLFTYFRLLVAPFGQNLDYEYSLANSIFEFPTILSLIGHLVILGLAVNYIRKFPLLALGVFWFYITIAVESGIIPLEDVIFEHRVYLPMFGFALLAPVAVFRLLGGISYKAAVAVLLAFGVFGSILTVNRNKVWDNELTLWQDVVKKSPNKPRPLTIMGSEFEKMRKSNEAMILYNKALYKDNYYPEAFLKRANLKAKLGMFREAIEDYRNYIENMRYNTSEPEYYKVFKNLANTYVAVGEYKLATDNYRKYLVKNKDDYRAYLGRAVSFYNLEEYEKALKDVETALELEPGIINIIIEKGRILNSLGRYGEARDLMVAHVAAHDKNPDLFYNIGKALAELKEYEDAIGNYSRAIRLDNSRPVFYLNRGLANMQAGQPDSARADFNKALELEPANASARNYLNKLN